MLYSTIIRFHENHVFTTNFRFIQNSSNDILAETNMAAQTKQSPYLFSLISIL